MQSTKTFLLPIYAKYTPSDVRMFTIFFVFVGSSNRLMLIRQRAYTLNAIVPRKVVPFGGQKREL